ncbi:hypothetical protein NP493_1046g00060 [Ridgeia piscesae]|uniref:Protein kinase domain-containing protein n=1 Tax=Ridgeia piscesae TaxID=27915 RepID=A0AAD9KHB6_RIDPI|nr:hypothetical protein NP493_1046g00060 [Ridgeia piscesae]
MCGVLQVQCLQDFFLDVNVFVAYGTERQTLDDYELSNNEIRFVSAYKTVRQTERITLRSPKVQRKYSFTPSLVNGDATHQCGARGMTPVSPSAGRKKRDLNPRARSAPGWKNGMDAPSNGHPGIHIAPAPMKLTAKYKVGKTIGQGNFAVVKDCVEKQTKERFALKIISKSLCRGREQMIHTEVSILRCLKHSNIVQLIEDFETTDELFLVMELVTGGDLFDAIASASNYTERDASGMLYNLASAVSHLHSLHIVHRDIKPENILVCNHSDGTKSLKLGDFGLAVEARTPLFTVCGTPTYVAPEILADTGYGLKVDVWAVGVITYILLCGFPPFASETNNQEDLFEKISSGKYEFTSPFWDGISDSAKELISYMLQKDTEDRYTATELLQHAWLSDDTAKDEDMHVGVASRIEENFVKCTATADRQPAMDLIACTALDHGSRYFQGKRPPLQPLQMQQAAHEDELF